MAKKATPSASAIINKVKTTSSGVKTSSVSNSGQMSTSTQRSGATGAAVNTTNIRVQGDPGSPAGQESEVIRGYRAFFGL